MTVYALMLLILVLGTAWLTRPWWAGAGRATVQRRASNIAIYRQRLAEIDNDLSVGLLDAAAADALRQELDSRLLQDTDGNAPLPAAPMPARRSAPAVALLALLLVVFSGGSYYLLGSWKIQALIEQAVADPAGAAQLSMDAMIEQLAAKLKQQPDDTEGWAMLGRSYAAVGRYADGASAYKRANELSGGQQPEWLVEEGEALGLARERDLQGRPRTLFEQALALAPDYDKALWYAGIAAAQAKDFDVARTRWTQLSKQELPEELRAALEQSLQQMPPLAGAPVASVDQAKAESPALRLRLRVTPELLSKIPAGASLFVFAKAAEGPPMPLAVYRGLATELPREVSLDDSMAMTPAMKLSQFDRWIVTARVSASGQAKAVTGDIEGSRPVTRAEAAGAIDIVLDRVVP